ncbi:hypothetical protein, partial [Bacillus pseudomycoides]|uniref:hypothetical protein n=1 Tax=Bacillus pseudomycoides TaxID=64104 RepID=UPI001C553A91
LYTTKYKTEITKNESNSRFSSSNTLAKDIIPIPFSVHTVSISIQFVFSQNFKLVNNKKD